MSRPIARVQVPGGPCGGRDGRERGPWPRPADIKPRPMPRTALPPRVPSSPTPKPSAPPMPERPPCRARTRRPSLSPRTVDPRSDHRAAPGPDARADRRAAAAPVPDARAGHRAAPVPDARTDLALDTVGEPTYVPTPVASFGPIGPSGWPSYGAPTSPPPPPCTGCSRGPSPAPSSARY